MKHGIIVIVYLLSTTFITGKAILIQGPKKYATKTQYTNINTRVISDQIETLMIEIRTLEQSIELLKYAQLLKKHNKTVICSVPEDARMLLSWCPYIDKVVSEDDQCNYDMKLTFQDLVSYLKLTDSNEPTPLIIVDETMLALWQEAFITDTNFKIGLSCQSDYGYRIPTTDLLSISTFIPLAAFKDTTLYSFDELGKNFPDTINFFYFDKQAKQKLTNLATFIYHMDIMITTQPLIAYISEALGKKTWLIVSPDTDKQEILQRHPHITIFVNTSENELLCNILHQLVHLISKPSAQIVTAEIAIGELIDKMTILEIKSEYIQDEKKLYNVYTELESLQKTFNMWIDANPELEQLIPQLKTANKALWITEDLIRDKEREKCFDNEFIQLARKVYLQNDERCRIKRRINELAGSRLMEEKSYKPY